MPENTDNTCKQNGETQLLRETNKTFQQEDKQCNKTQQINKQIQLSLEIDKLSKKTNKTFPWKQVSNPVIV